MSQTKRQVRSLLNRLPDDVTLEDLQYHLYVIQKIERGLADERAGRLIPHEKIKEMVASWGNKSAGARNPLKTSKKSTSTSRATQETTRRLRSAG